MRVFCLSCGTSFRDISVANTVVFIMADGVIELTAVRVRQCLAAAMIIEMLEEDGRRTGRRGKTRSWIRRREEKGYFNNIVQELRIEDTAGYREMMRMTHEDFLAILSRIEPDITPRQVTGGHKVISPAERLTLTLRFLATGETYRSLSFQFRISKSAISYIVNEVCQAIEKNLGPEYLKFPSSHEEWLNIASQFELRWNFPNCIGAIDGKHIIMQPPANAGSYYYNYKHTNSIVLMAVAGPDYECLYADVGTNGRVSDGGVWNKCTLSQGIEDGSVSLPPPKCLPYGVAEIPHVFVGDDAFALKKNLMKPYAQNGLTMEKRVYNYRHSRARRISENLFGIVTNRFRVFRTVLQLAPRTIESLVMTGLILHNYLRKSPSRNIYCPQGLIDSESDSGEVTNGLWRQDSPLDSFLPLSVPVNGHNASNYAKQVRDSFKDFFVNEGAVEWQWRMILIELCLK